MIWLYTHPEWVLALVLAASAVSAYGFAGEMAHAGRRFGTLNTNVVSGEVDKLRNSRWHDFGLGLRIWVGGLIGLAFGQMTTQFPEERLLMTWGLTWLVSFCFMSLLFDPIFNLKFGQAWGYLGDTSDVDRYVAMLGRDDLNDQERAVWVTLAKLLAVVVACFLWWWLI